MRLFGSLKELVSAVFRKNTNQITLQPNSGVYTGDVTVELPNQLAAGTTVLVGEATSQSLTNKTIDADSNTITNIENADIKVGAAIDRTKLASGTQNHVIINNGSGALSSEAQLAKSRGGAGADMTNVTFPATGVLVTRDALESLSNKTLDDTSLLSAARLQNAQVRMQGTANGVSSLEFYEDGSIGTNKVSVRAPGLGESYYFELPPNAGNPGDSAVLAAPNGKAGSGSSTKASTSWVRYASTNTNSTLVQRDISGNFSAGTITANLTGNASGTASNVTGIVLGANGGTGVDNTGKTITLGGNLTTSGAFNTTLTTTALTNVTLPTTGTLATLAGSEALSSKTITASSISSDPATTVGVGALKLPTGNSTTDRPTGTAAQLKGMVRYNDTDDVFEGYNELSGWSSIGGGGTTDRVTQASHGFAVGDTLYLNGSTYTKAIATSAAAAEVVGVVSRVIDSSTFELTLSGEVSGLSGLTTGEVYFLSAATAGALTTTEPSVIGQVSVPVGVASSASTLYVAPKRGAIVGGTAARTEISLANTTSAQTIYTAPSGLVAGELAGWVYIDAATDYRFYLAAQFAQNGANNNWNLSYQTSGDTPPTGFSVSITSGGAIQVTMNPVPTSFVSGSVNYSINGPAVGATFPLSVDSTQVNFNTIKAKDSTGLVFQENGGTTTGTVSDAGGWTLGTPGGGASTASSRHTIRADYPEVLNINNTASGGTQSNINFALAGSTLWQVGTNNDFGTNGFFWYWAGSGAKYVGGVSTAGAWTFGPSGGLPSTLSYHVFNGSTSTGSAAMLVYKKTGADSSSNYYMECYAGNGSTVQGGLWNNASGDFATYTSSDARIKTDIRDAEYGLEQVMQLKPRTFTKEGIENVKGFIAQEVKEVLPESVGFRNTPEFEDLHILEMQTMIPIMVKAIQELKAELDATKAELAELKASR